MMIGSIVLVHLPTGERFATVRNIQGESVEISYLTGLVRTVDAADCSIWNPLQRSGEKSAHREEKINVIH